MPIYEYRCTDCGQSKDHLQKVSDEPIAACPACGSAAYAKQLSAAGFQLKGSGWYATDFKGGGSSGSAASSTTAAPSTSGSNESSASSSAAPSTPCGGSCACH